MRAVVFQNELAFTADHPDPTPGDGECLVRVHLAGICSTDLQITRGYMNFAGVLGHEFVGTVVEGSKAWKGQRVVAEINCVCCECDMCLTGLSPHCRRRTVLGIDGHDGAFADLVAVPERNLHAVPEKISDEEAVFVEPLAAAHQVIAQCPIDERSTVTVIGPGRLGLLVAQVLATTGCRLTVVGRSEKKLSLCEKKGVQAIAVGEVVARQDRDVVVECTGHPDGLKLAMAMVRPRGTIVLKSTYADPASPNLAPLVINEVTLLGSRCGPFPEAINALSREAADVRSMISKTFPIEEAVKAFEVATAPEAVKVQLKINPR